MTLHRLLAVALVASFAFSACSRGTDGGRDDAAHRSDAGERLASPTEGAPRIVMAPDGVHIQYRVYGTGDPAVVLVHGWSCDSSYWNAQLQDLKRQYTVMTLDLAGHGASGRNRAEWTIAGYAGDVVAAVRELDASRIVLVGHSMGGPVALEAASRLGERVIGIIGVDTFKEIDQPPRPPAVIERFVEPFSRDFIGTTRTWVTETFFTPDTDPQLVRSIADDMSRAPPDVAIPSIAAVNSVRFEDVLPGIDVPIIAINGDRPPVTDADRIGRTVPRFRAVIVENTGHFLMMEAPDRFNPILLREIATLAGDPGE